MQPGFTSVNVAPTTRLNPPPLVRCRTPARHRQPGCDRVLVGPDEAFLARRVAGPHRYVLPTAGSTPQRGDLDARAEVYGEDRQDGVGED